MDRFFMGLRINLRHGGDILRKGLFGNSPFAQVLTLQP